MMHADLIYKNLIQEVLETGVPHKSRAGHTLSIFGYQCRFDLNKGFPALTTKKLAWKSVVAELLWFLEGSDDERRLAEITYGRPRAELVGQNTIWTANADAQGVALGHPNTDEVKRLGPVYGAQWRSWGAFGQYGASYLPSGGREGDDQVTELIHKLRHSPDDRRLILSAWNVGDIPQMALPPCHCFAQFRVYNGRLHCLMYQRSADLLLGVPFNWASYALLTHIIAREVGLGVGDFIWSAGDVHIYEDHINGAKEQLTREPYPLPNLIIDEKFSLEDTLGGETPSTATDFFKLENYLYHPTIKFDMAV